MYVVGINSYKYFSFYLTNVYIGEVTGSYRPSIVLLGKWAAERMSNCTYTFKLMYSLQSKNDQT